MTRVSVVVRARSPGGCHELWDTVQAGLPAELVGLPIEDEDRLRVVIRPLGDRPALVEVRRSIDDVGLTLGPRISNGPDLPAVAAWAPQPEGLRRAATVMSRIPEASMVLVHLEPHRASRGLLEHLDSTIRDIAVEQDEASATGRAEIMRHYRSLLGSLPHASLHLRVVVGTTASPSTSLQAAVGVALTRDSRFEVLVPQTDRAEIGLRDMLDIMSAPPPETEPVQELSVIASAGEAAAVARLPVPSRGGTPGLVSAPVPLLPRSAGDAREGSAHTLRLGQALGGGPVNLGLSSLAQHLLVSGLPGFGKSLTTQTILSAADKAGIPFLVVDPAKGDYRSLASVVPHLVTISLGPENYAFNPFGVPPGCPRSTHAGRVLASFDAAFGLSRTWPLGYVTLARAIYAAYDADEVPTLATLRQQLADVIHKSRFTGPDGANLRASLLGRIDFLRRGPLGISLSAPANGALDYEVLTAGPTLIELRNFGGPAERALVFALLLAGLISYREHNPLKVALGHITVLEEAHRLLRAETDGPSNEGIRMFVEAIAELRGSGEGFVVVDQAPTLLDRGIMKLAGSHIAHRLVDLDERTTVGAALLLSEDESRDLARLGTGHAVFHSVGRHSSVVVEVEPPIALLSPRPSALPVVSRTRPPWRPQVMPNDGGSLTERVRQLSEHQSWLDVVMELVNELAATSGDAGGWRSGLEDIARAVREEGMRQHRNRVKETSRE